jgi:hypothetical protein
MCFGTLLTYYMRITLNEEGESAERTGETTNEGQHHHPFKWEIMSTTRGRPLLPF